MAQRFGKTLTAPLLAIFAVQMALPLVLVLLTLIVKHRQHEVVASHSYTQSIKVRLSDVNAANLEEGEIVVQGIRYDIAETIEHGGDTYVIAIADEHETSLADTGEKLFEKETKGSKNRSQPPFFSFLFYEQPAQWQPPACIVQATTLTGFIQPLLPFTIVGLTGPPPRV